MRHGTENFYVTGEGWISGLLFPLKLLIKLFRKLGAYPDPMPMPQPPSEEPEHIFCRILPKGSPPDHDDLVELGMAMEVERAAGLDAEGNSNIPAGYTYLGQFIDHDITLDATKIESTDPFDPKATENMRTPSLDLDSVYGPAPDGVIPGLGGVFQPDNVHLRVGLTSETISGEPGGPINGGLSNDLPRRASDKTAIIGDKRNDENLAVAQTHLAFIKFHNAWVDKLASEQGLSGDALRDAARKEVTLHYQSIVLTDFLPRIVQEKVLHDVLDNGRKLYTDEDHKDCMPLEFSVAAYRMGHSMVRPVYEWNRVFNISQGGIPASLEFLFEFTKFSGTTGAAGDETLRGKPTLPSNWIIDWTRFYDFSNVDGVNTHPNMNFARDLDARLAFGLKELPEFKQMSAAPELLSLATRNLLRGRLVSLPTGQEAVAAMQGKGIDVNALDPDRIASNVHESILRDHDFHKETPLWYYILREAKLVEDGNKLGPVGSRIVAEVFVGLIENSRTSLLTERPNLEFSMPELLAFVGDLNPIG